MRLHALKHPFVDPRTARANPALWAIALACAAAVSSCGPSDDNRTDGSAIGVSTVDVSTAGGEQPAPPRVWVSPAGREIVEGTLDHGHVLPLDVRRPRRSRLSVPPADPRPSRLRRALVGPGEQDVYVAVISTGAVFSDGFESGDTSSWSGGSP